MAARKHQQAAPVESAADKQKREDATRRMRLDCLKLAVEMRTGTSNAVGITNIAEALVGYVNTGKPVEKG